MSYTPYLTDREETADDTPEVRNYIIDTGTYEAAIQLSSGDNRKMIVFMFGLKLIAGTATIIDSVATILSVDDAGLAAATAVITTNAESMRITLTGIAATDIVWIIRLRKLL